MEKKFIADEKDRIPYGWSTLKNETSRSKKGGRLTFIAIQEEDEQINQDIKEYCY